MFCQLRMSVVFSTCNIRTQIDTNRGSWSVALIGTSRCLCTSVFVGVLMSTVPQTGNDLSIISVIQKNTHSEVKGKKKKKKEKKKKEEQRRTKKKEERRRMKKKEEERRRMKKNKEEEETRKKKEEEERRKKKKEENF